ncbi:MAG: ribosome-associated translation inhibitor RaiA [Deltaproteobacteria bacterium]|nr:ribosome-associated translation inhibitor RaiA [Deltaproteobacteria bacterium]
MTNHERKVNVTIAFKNTEATEPIKKYATEKITHSIQKFVHHDTDAHVILRVEKNRQIAEATFHVDGADFIGREESADLYAAIDALADSLTQQLRRHKDKMTQHHQ